MPIQIREIERNHEIQIVRDKFYRDRKRVEIEQPKAKPRNVVILAFADKPDKFGHPTPHGYIGMLYRAFVRFQRFAVFIVIVVLRF